MLPGRDTLQQLQYGQFQACKSLEVNPLFHGTKQLRPIKIF